MQKGVSYLALGSLPGALKFYRRLGFKKVQTWSEGGKAHPDEMTLAEGHIYMEHHLPKGKGKSKKSR